MSFLLRSDREQRLELLLRDLLEWAMRAEQQMAEGLGSGLVLKECGSLESEIVNAARFLRDNP